MIEDKWTKAAREIAAEAEREEAEHNAVSEQLRHQATSAGIRKPVTEVARYWREA